MNYRWTHLIGYVILLFLWPTINSSQMFTAGTASSPLHISVFTFSPLICKHGECECSSSSRPATKFRSSGGQWWNANSILYVPTEELSDGRPGSPVPVWTFWRRENSPALAGNRTTIHRSSRLKNHLDIWSFHSVASWPACRWRWSHYDSSKHH